MHDQLTSNARALATMFEAESFFRVKAILLKTGLRHNCAFARALWAR